MKTIKPIKIAHHTLGEGHPCFVIAEIGINHNGDMALAHDMIIAAKNSGADAVKFQNYLVDDFIIDKKLTYSYKSNGKLVTESQYDMFKRSELSFEQLLQLKEWCDKEGVVFFSTPTSGKTLRETISVGSQLIKNGSDFLTNIPLLKEMALTGLPTLISVGMATLEEIEDAVNVFEKQNVKENLALMLCTSAYPTPPSDVNLRRIPELKKMFDVNVGFSDHTKGIVAAIGAAALGAVAVEKHFTIDNTLDGPDHPFSSTPEEMKQLSQAVKELYLELGSGKIEDTQIEKKSRQDFRLSCVASKSLNVGHVITHEDIIFVRPGIGMSPKLIDEIVGKRLIVQLTRGDLFSKELLCE